MLRHHSLLDTVLINFDQGLRTLTGAAVASRANPAAEIVDTKLSAVQQKHAAGLMRVNHAGEVCAQALYQGQALVADKIKVRETLEQAACEEHDHLAWCQQRLRELESHTSYLDPVWYLGSFLLGIMAGLISDRFSLGFVAETERQVVEHLDKHLQQLPATDAKSMAVLQQMRTDELHHATTANQAGAVVLPVPVQVAMQITSKIMTTLAYWI